MSDCNAHYNPNAPNSSEGFLSLRRAGIKHCPVCGHDSWCMVSRRGDAVLCMRVIDSPDGKARELSDGTPYGLHSATDAPLSHAEGYERAARAMTACEIAPVETRHAVYSALLDALALSPAHRAALALRGLSSAAIDARGYRTLPPPSARKRVVAQVRATLGTMGAQLDSIPGLYKGKLSGAEGLLIPVRDTEGRIVACKVRVDNPGDGGKYRWLSSAHEDGPGPGAPCHVPLVPASEGLSDNALSDSYAGLIRVTEGPLKADVATHRSGVLTLGVASCTAARTAVDVLRALNARVVRIALDADFRSNPHVARGLALAVKVYRDAGYEVEVETWDGALAKGIDDALVAGVALSVHRGADVDRVTGQGTAQSTGQGTQGAASGASHALAKVTEVSRGKAQSKAMRGASGDESDDWESLLVRQGRNPKPTFGNLCKIFRHAPEFKGKFRRNLMTQAIEFDGASLPEARALQIRERCEDAPWGGFQPEKGTLFDAIFSVASERAYHPVREYLNGLVWDGDTRIDYVVTHVLNLPESQVTDLERAMVRKWFVSAARRALHPGVKCDTALVLIGDQGYGKSTFFKVLGGAWFGETEIKIGDKDGLQQIHANWITEWGEIDHITGARHAGEVKQFVSRCTDDFRPPYARNVERFERSCVIVGSTNNQWFLNDPTGARRFWCVRVVSAIDTELLAKWRDQLWAEAVMIAKTDEHHYLTGAAASAHAQAVEAHRVRDPFEQLIGTWLADVWPHMQRETGRTHLQTTDVMLYGLELKPRDCTKVMEMRVADAMRALGRENKRVRLRPSEHALYGGKTSVHAWVEASVVKASKELDAAPEIEFVDP